MLKKTLGIFLLILGLVVENIGMFGIGQTGGQLKLIDGQIQPELFERYRNVHDKSLMIGGGFIAVGLILIIIGVVLVMSKAQTKKENS